MRLHFGMWDDPPWPYNTAWASVGSLLGILLGFDFCTGFVLAVLAVFVGRWLYNALPEGT